MPIGFNTNDVPSVIERPDGIPCERCGGWGETEREWPRPGGGYYDAPGPCPDCGGSGKLLCCACGERPAIAELHWHREQPGYEGPAVDELCQPCLEETLRAEEPCSTCNDTGYVRDLEGDPSIPNGTHWREGPCPDCRERRRVA